MTSEATDQQQADFAAIQIVALGSPHGDDRIAWDAAKQLQGDGWLARSVRKISSPWDLFDSLHSGTKVIILDPCRSGAPVGTLLELREQDLQEYSDRGCSTHGGSISECLGLARALGRNFDEVVVLAVEDDEPSNAGFRDADQQAVRKLVAGVRQVLSRWHLID